MFQYGDKLPGRIFLLVTGIIYIVVGSFVIFGSLAMIEMMQSPARSLWSMAGIQSIEYIIYSFIMGIFYLCMGIVGIKHRNNRAYAWNHFNLGIAAIIFDLGGSAFFSTFSPTALITLALPICYMVGAHKNK